MMPVRRALLIRCVLPEYLRYAGAFSTLQSEDSHRATHNADKARSIFILHSIVMFACRFKLTPGGK
jgi:hypothetical protein